MGSLSGIAAVIIGSAWAYYSLRHQEYREDQRHNEEVLARKIDEDRLKVEQDRDKAAKVEKERQDELNAAARDERHRVESKRLQMMVKGVPLVKGDQKFIRIDTYLKNSGLGAIESTRRGCELTVVKVAKAVKDGEVFDLNSEKFDKKNSIIYKYPSLPGTRDEKTGKSITKYLIEPGLEYREVNLVRVSEPGLYFIRMRFFIGERGSESHESTMTDCTVVDMP